VPKQNTICLSNCLIAAALYFAVNSYQEIVPQLPDAQEFECLVKNVYYEAGIESFRGKVAVAEVTMNRVRDSRYPKTICGVVYQHKQFSWTIKPPKGKPDPEVWLESMQAAVVGYNNQTIEATHYHNFSVNPVWGLQRLYSIGHHIFYK
jgi:spore germination cell wall hydrolase CwlJ-like protein